MHALDHGVGGEKQRPAHRALPPRRRRRRSTSRPRGRRGSARRMVSIAASSPSGASTQLWTLSPSADADVPCRWLVCRLGSGRGPRLRSANGRDSQPQASRLGRRGRCAHPARPGRVVRRFGRGVRPPVPAARRPGHLHQARPTRSARTATGPARTRPTSPGWRAAPLSARRSGRRRPEQQLDRPRRDAGHLDRAVPGLRCGAAPCTSCPFPWARSARPSPISASRSPTRPMWS